jgi:hypothetical protein
LYAEKLSLAPRALHDSFATSSNLLNSSAICFATALPNTSE